MKKFLLLLTVTLSVIHCGYACGPFARAYRPDEYYTFRVLGEDMEGSEGPQAKSLDEQKRENLDAWAKLTSEEIPQHEIESVVYNWSYDKMKSTAETFATEHSRNRFIGWLQDHHDQEIMDFLLLAKECEYLRARQNTYWYYYYEGDSICQRLSSIVKRAKAYRGKRLADRYVVQQLRAYFGMRQYEQCPKLWYKSKKIFQNGIIKDLAVGYVAGSYMRMNEQDKANKLYIENQQMGDAMLCLKEKDPEKIFYLVYEQDPNHPWLLSSIQSRIHKIERYGRWNNAQDYAPLYAAVQKIINEGKCKDLASWYYTAAFLADAMGKKESAWTYICQSEEIVRRKDLRESIRVLKMYIRVKNVEKYTPEYENELFADLYWLDNKIVSNLTADVKERLSDECISNHICGYSQYYWNDMMRKILIGQVVPLCIKSGYKARALQYLNMADNRIFCLIGSMKFYEWRYDRMAQDYITIDATMSMDEYRRSEKFTNEYDYCNDLFFNLDSLGVQSIINMVNRMENPRCPLDKFLKERSYNDLEYFYDIIGTHLIASMRYEEAISYLEKVSDDFQRSRNVFSYCSIDPFTEEGFKDPSPTYKLDFARKMARLKRQAATAEDSDQKAELSLKYAKGLIKSIDKDCWPLTCYFWGSASYSPIYTQYRIGLSKQILLTAMETKRKAFAMFSDKEKKAKAYVDWKMFKSAVTRCPNTQTAAYVKGHCDKLYDYQVKPKVYPSLKEW